MPLNGTLRFGPKALALCGRLVIMGHYPHLSFVEIESKTNKTNRLTMYSKCIDTSFMWETKSTQEICVAMAEFIFLYYWKVVLYVAYLHTAFEDVVI